MTKRANGEGTICQRKDGRWQGQAYVLLPSGARTRRTVYGLTRAEVHAKVTALVHQAQRGIPAPNTRLTVGEYLTTWLEEVARRKVRPTTYQVYESTVRVHLVPALGHRRLAQLSPADIRRVLNAKSDQGLAPATVKKIHLILGSALQHAVRDDLLTRNVARLVQVPVPRQQVVRSLDVAEARLLLQAASSDRLYALWAVALGIGLRKGEALGLGWSNVDLEAATLLVERSLQSVGGHPQLLPTKTARSVRAVRLPAVCVHALRAHRARQDREREQAGASWQPSGLVFTMQDGSPVHPRYVNRWLDELCERAGIPRLRVHDLRHTCATLLLAQGVGMRVVMEILGHSQIGVTMNTYTHALPALAQDAANRMDEALGMRVAVTTAVDNPSTSEEQASGAPKTAPDLLF